MIKNMNYYISYKTRLFNYLLPQSTKHYEVRNSNTLSTTKVCIKIGDVWVDKDGNQYNDAGVKQ